MKNKRILSVVMAAAMMLTSLPMAFSAASNAPAANPNVIEIPAEEFTVDGAAVASSAGLAYYGTGSKYLCLDAGAQLSFEFEEGANFAWEMRTNGDGTTSPNWNFFQVKVDATSVPALAGKAPSKGAFADPAVGRVRKQAARTNFYVDSQSWTEASFAITHAPLDSVVFTYLLNSVSVYEWKSNYVIFTEDFDGFEVGTTFEDGDTIFEVTFDNINPVTASTDYANVFDGIFKVSISGGSATVVEDEAYYIAKVKADDAGNAGEFTYTANTDIALTPGVYKINGFFRNGKMNYDWIGNNTFDLGAKVSFTDGGTSLVSVNTGEETAKVDVGGWQEVTFTFNVNDDVMLDELTFTALHTKYGNEVPTIGGTAGVDYLSADECVVEFKDISIELVEIIDSEDGGSAFGIIALLLMKKKAAAQTPVVPEDTTAETEETTEAEDTTVEAEDTTAEAEDTTAESEEDTTAESEEDTTAESEAPVDDSDAIYKNDFTEDAVIAEDRIGDKATADNAGIYTVGIISRNKIEQVADGDNRYLSVTDVAKGSNYIYVNTGITLEAGEYVISADLKAENAQNMSIFVQNPDAPANSYIKKPGQEEKPVDANAKINDIGHVETKSVAVGTDWTNYTNTIKLEEPAVLVLKISGTTLNDDLSNFSVDNIVVAAK